MKPTVEARLKRRFILMTEDRSLIDDLQKKVPEGWEMVVAADLESLGDWHAILLHRFLILDLQGMACDPLEVVETLRRDYLLNIPIFCLGEQDRALKAMGADRFFPRAGFSARLADLCRPFG
ncbi:MAG: hypothetical protein D6819_04550 [Gammaproteobacteria bacterium]|nr:MAG: hypothetical protein D6819_04550 [Gammaproteobacteria bacterium]